MAILFRSSKALQAAVDEYLDKISQGVLTFQMGVKNYLDEANELGQLPAKSPMSERKIVMCVSMRPRTRAR